MTSGIPTRAKPAIPPTAAAAASIAAAAGAPPSSGLASRIAFFERGSQPPSSKARANMAKIEELYTTLARLTETQAAEPGADSFLVAAEGGASSPPVKTRTRNPSLARIEERYRGKGPISKGSPRNRVWNTEMEVDRRNPLSRVAINTRMFTIIRFKIAQIESQLARLNKIEASSTAKKDKTSVAVNPLHAATLTIAELKSKCTNTTDIKVINHLGNIYRCLTNFYLELKETLAVPETFDSWTTFNDLEATAAHLANVKTGSFKALLPTAATEVPPAHTAAASKPLTVVSGDVKTAGDEHRTNTAVAAAQKTARQLNFDAEAEREFIRQYQELLEHDKITAPGMYQNEELVLTDHVTRIYAALNAEIQKLPTDLGKAIYFINLKKSSQTATTRFPKTQAFLDTISNVMRIYIKLQKPDPTSGGSIKKFTTALGLFVPLEGNPLQLRRCARLNCQKLSLDVAESIKSLPFEAKLQQSFDHPSIVKVYDFCHAPYDGKNGFKKFVIYAEHCNGGDLYTFFQKSLKKTFWKDGSLTHPLITKDARATQLVPIVSQIASALSYLHNTKLLTHADLKPENCLVNKIVMGTGAKNELGHQFKLTDFGVSLPETRPELFGTPYFYCPELAPKYMSDYQGYWYEQKEIVAPSSDMWALGVMLYELYSGSLPAFSNLLWGIHPTLMHRLTILSRESPPTTVESAEMLTLKEVIREFTPQIANVSCASLAISFQPHDADTVALLETVNTINDYMAPLVEKEVVFSTDFMQAHLSLIEAYIKKMGEIWAHMEATKPPVEQKTPDQKFEALVRRLLRPNAKERLTSAQVEQYINENFVTASNVVPKK